MTIRRKLRSRVLHVLLHSRTVRMQRALRESRRRLLRRPHVVTAFLQLDDPYSYLLAHYLPEFAAQFDVEFRLHLSEACGGVYQPAPELLSEYAVMDCRRLARELAVPFLDEGRAPPVEHRKAMLDVIAGCADGDDFDDELLRALRVFWRGDAEAAGRMVAGRDSPGAGEALVAKSSEPPQARSTAR